MKIVTICVDSSAGTLAQHGRDFTWSHLTMLWNTPALLVYPCPCVMTCCALHRDLTHAGPGRYYLYLILSSMVLIITFCLVMGLFCGFCGRRPGNVYGDDTCNKGAGANFLLRRENRSCLRPVACSCCCPAGDLVLLLSGRWSGLVVVRPVACSCCCPAGGLFLLLSGRWSCGVG